MEDKGNVGNSQFQFSGYNIVESNLKVGVNSDKKELEFNINPKGEFKENNALDVTLNVLISNKAKDFQVSMTMVGNFTYQCEDNTDLKHFIGCNAPAIMFPYVRSFISCLTGLAGIRPIVLPTLNMVSVGKLLIKQLEKAEMRQ